MSMRIIPSQPTCLNLKEFEHVGFFMHFSIQIPTIAFFSNTPGDSIAAD
jgi:hypothetical protein